ncbi:hypothetical protein [Thermosynechococcus sp. TA-1]|uniref:hypothetical protein n=1 Tax=Thermosynechococcus sp. TA-1 TaxID=2813673 RepID=UPI0019819289|nr:hypothetical protein [Thermosynechococcus sp. TA-1]QSF48958.1 hypothetical protein JW907_11610 [Thermosynechococcus sp. TA-1]
MTVNFLAVSYQRFYYPRMSELLKYKETLIIDRSTRKIIWENPKTKFRREYDFPDIEAMIVQKYVEVIQGRHGRSWEQNHFKIYFTLNVPGPPRRVPLYQGCNDAIAESLITQIPKFLPVKIEHQQLSHRPEED